MVHNEHLRKADELYEVRHDNNGNAIHVYIKDGQAVVFPTLDDLVRRVYFGEDTERFYCSEDLLFELYEGTGKNPIDLLESKSYDYYTLKGLREALN